MSSPTKKAKTADSKEEEKKDVEMAEEKEPEPPKEHETDQKTDPKPKIKDTVAFLTPDSTVNVAISTFGNMLMPLTEGGLSHLLAGARANVGVKSGRYMFEAKIIEQMSLQDGGQGSKSIFRVGFSTAGSAPLLGDEGSVCFDADGSFFSGKAKSSTGKRFFKDTIVAVVLNLEEKHPNSNTVSLFIAGERATQPMPLPESLKGKILFPTVSFKNCTVHYSFGPSPISPLPFKCKTMADATMKDATVTKFDKPADGAYEVLFPAGLPEEGAYDWLDLFLTKNSSYTEISNRAVIAWALKSGVFPSAKQGGESSKDHPATSFGVPSLDSFAIKDAIIMAANLQPRNLVVMDLKGCLLKEDRAMLASKFSGNPAFKVVATVIVGEPTLDFKKKTNELVLKDKQDKSDREFKAKKAEEKRQKLMEKKKKEEEKRRAKLAKEQKKKAEAAKKIKEAAQKKKAKEIEKAKKVAAAKAKAKAEGKEYVPEEEVEEEEEKEEEKKPEEPEEEEEEEEAEEEEPEKEEAPPKVTLTPDEKAIWFYKSKQPDLSSYALSTNFTSFSLPEKEDGFAEIRCEWTKPSSKCATYVTDWILAKKQTTRVEDLKPSAWFMEKSRIWTAALQKWKDSANAYKNMLAKKAADKLAKERKKAAAKQAKERQAAAAKAKAAREEAAKALKKKQNEEKAAKGEKVEEEKEEEEEKKEEEPAMEVEEEEEEEEKEPEVDFENLDIFGVEDICDIGGKMPLFKEFQFEDWTLLGLKYELSLLVHAFKKDVDDPERTGIHLDHLAFYYNKYYKKPLDTKFYGVDTVKELLGLVDDSVYVVKSTIVQTQLPEEMESLGGLVKATEEGRRHRNLLLDMGKEEAKLKIKAPGGGQKRTYEGEKKQGGGWSGNKGGWGGGWKPW